MTRADPKSLTQAFEATDYRVQTGADWHTVNIGQPCPDALRAWLNQHCSGPCGWIVTAWNPNAEQAEAADNKRSDAALRAILDSTAHHYTDTTTAAQQDDWPAEPGVCILDMDEGLARALALRFGQTAIVAVPLGGPAQLLWIEP